MNAPRRPGGFTLIELLVVTAILAVLAALAIPVTGALLDRGADAADMSNLRQIGTGMSQFAAENNGRWPNAKIPVPGAASGLEAVFMEHVDRMFTPDSAFSASSRYNWQRRPLWYSKRFARMPAGKSFPSSRHYWGTAWGINTHLWGSTSTNLAFTFDGYINTAPNLSRLVIVGEKNRNGGNDFRPNEAPVFENNVESSYRISRNRKAYYLFGDYHIESIEGDQSTIANPGFTGRNSHTNRLYYRWW